MLVVTHQKHTMEIAGMMYGVSLNKDGTTRVVCQRLEHPDAAAPAAEASSQEPAVLDVPQGEPVG